MIIRDDDTGARDVGTFVLRSQDRKLSFSLEVPAELTDDLRDHLREKGFNIPEGDARGVWSEVVVATAGNPAAWTAVGGTVVAFLRRHRGKVHRFKANGRSVSIEGYSAEEAERLAADLTSWAQTNDPPGHRTEPGDGTPR